MFVNGTMAAKKEKSLLLGAVSDASGSFDYAGAVKAAMLVEAKSEWFSFEITLAFYNASFCKNKQISFNLNLLDAVLDVGKSQVQCSDTFCVLATPRRIF